MRKIMCDNRIQFKAAIWELQSLSQLQKAITCHQGLSYSLRTYCCEMHLCIKKGFPGIRSVDR